MLAMTGRRACVFALLPPCVHAYSSYKSKIPNANLVVGCDGAGAPGVGHVSRSGPLHLGWDLILYMGKLLGLEVGR